MGIGKNAIVSPLRWQFSVSSTLYLAVVVALASGWLLDRMRLNRHLELTESRYEKKIDRLHLGLTVQQDAITLANIYREHQISGQGEFLMYLQGTMIGQILQIYAAKSQVNEVELTDSDSRTLARKLVTLLGCETSEEFLEKATQLGFKESDFLLTYNPRPNELDEFYRFLGFDD